MLLEILQELIKKIEISEFIDKDNKKVEPDEEEKKLIYVFNEEFIEENIKIESEGLNTIMIMGEEKNIDDEIKKLEPNYNKCIELLEEQKKKKINMKMSKIRFLLNIILKK